MMTDETHNLNQALAYQIKHNITLLINYVELRNTPGVLTAFAEAMITKDLNQALEAIGSQELEDMIRAYEALKGNE
jgi:hypothetical protein